MCLRYTKTLFVGTLFVYNTVAQGPLKIVILRCVFKTIHFWQMLLFLYDNNTVRLYLVLRQHRRSISCPGTTVLYRLGATLSFPSLGLTWGGTATPPRPAGGHGSAGPSF